MWSGINCILCPVNQQLSLFQLSHIYLKHVDNGTWYLDATQTPNIDRLTPCIQRRLWCRVKNRIRGRKYVRTGTIWMIFFLSKIKYLLRTPILISLVKKIRFFIYFTKDRRSVSEVTNEKALTNRKLNVVCVKRMGSRWFFFLNFFFHKVNRKLNMFGEKKIYFSDIFIFENFPVPPLTLVSGSGVFRYVSYR